MADFQWPLAGFISPTALFCIIKVGCPAPGIWAEPLALSVPSLLAGEGCNQRLALVRGKASDTLALTEANPLIRLRVPRRHLQSELCSSPLPQGTKKSDPSNSCLIVKQQMRVCILAAAIARVVQKWLPKREGAGNAGCATHPRPRVRRVKSTRVSHHRYA
jgi:hypothetical protein